MSSPFPGMNPFLEQDDVWEDFHHNFLTWSEAALNAELGPNYLARIETRLYIRELSDEERHFFGRGDVTVSLFREGARGRAAAGLSAPVELVLPEMDTARESWLEIRDRRNRRVITVIELLSPTNKRSGPNRDAYLGKRNGLLASESHFVEIDLRRGGTRPDLPPLPPCDYYVFICRYELRPRIGFWPIGLREKLPVIPVPLLPSDPPVDLDLQRVLNQTYDVGDYGKTIYAETPDPPLSPDDAEWARQIIAGTNGDGASR
jgi:hypothetical protein